MRFSSVVVALTLVGNVEGFGVSPRISAFTSASSYHAPISGLSNSGRSSTALQSGPSTAGPDENTGTKALVSLLVFLRTFRKVKMRGVLIGFAMVRMDNFQLTSLMTNEQQNCPY